MRRPAVGETAPLEVPAPDWPAVEPAPLVVGHVFRKPGS